MVLSFIKLNTIFEINLPIVALLLYRLFIHLYVLAARLIAPLNPKAALWVAGRKNIFRHIKQTISTGEKIIWFHCSSLGEFEQGRPVIEKLREKYPLHKILITFFSPSGYEACKNYTGADYIFYLPMDGKKHAAAFFDIVQPSLAVYVKYEYWHYYLHQAKSRGVPLLLISAIFRRSQSFFSFYGNFYRRMLACFTHIFVQNKESVDLLASIGYSHTSLSGDTRFDRVIEIASQPKEFDIISAFCGGSNVVVAGSTWSDDDKELDHFANTRRHVKFIVAPHNIDKSRLDECLRLYKNAVLYSTLSRHTFPEGTNTIIIDNIGMLGSLYRYATVCYIGGGFGADGVHNVLEAAVYGRPVVFGPEYDKYAEAVELVENGGGISINNALELEKKLDHLLEKDTVYYQKCKAANDYVYSRQGAAALIVQYIQEKRLLTT